MQDMPIRKCQVCEGAVSSGQQTPVEGGVAHADPRDCYRPDGRERYLAEKAARLPGLVAHQELLARHGHVLNFPGGAS